MRSGRMSRTTLTIQTIASSQDAIGGETKTPSTLCASWPCELVEVAGGETFRGRQVHGRATFVAVGRYVAGVTTKHRCTLGARTFDVLRSVNAGNRGREMRLELMERGV